MDTSARIRVFTFLWIAVLIVTFFYAVYVNNKRDLWTETTLLDLVTVITPVVLIAYSVRKSSNVMLGITWVILAIASWDIFGHFPGSWVSGLIILIAWAWGLLAVALTRDSHKETVTPP